ncbi:ATP-binding cassette domain-containing protein [Cellulomonas shaoxiangyii]|uniref:ATP-binding cassette domain-containing protein n=1 Tax=Cellulomonas shaoxiangyii TaxID=2566013 RepID=A0A4P7SFD7_9CELL|nr:ATP-binding cassette domain-containing protein [Cellulomonas shaoxiangyii]QCB92258.1 ATP-binding cassette domain-containing protein [Cellulomonas shaoxiangyii]TGY85930.1 ATP-binding cassette domain-containing protein [Cellulomonas shaoxiangyii]
MDEAMIAARGLRKAYGGRAVLDGVDLTAHRGQVVGLLGPNGAGKTTVVRILSTLVAPDGGAARVAGFDVVRQAARVRGAISLTGQYAAVDELLTGEENLRLAARLAHLPRGQVRGDAADMLELFDLTDAARRTVRTYSGGMRRRLDLAVSLLSRPQVLFLDEPTTGLDPRSRNALWDVVRSVAAAGGTVLLTTQYLEEADALADRVVVIDRGVVIAEGTAARLKSAVGSAHVEVVLADGTTRRTATDGSVADVRRILADVEQRALDVVHWQVRTPTLDDAFLALTGQDARPGPRAVPPALVPPASAPAAPAPPALVPPAQEPR